MGASLIELTSRGASIREAYDKAVEDAIYENGNDSYNGTISTTSGVDDHTSKYKSSGMSLSDYAEYLYENNKISKWGNAVGICTTEPIVNNNKIKSVVNTTPQKGTRTWKTVYEVRLWNNTVINSSEFQADAIKKGREYSEKTKEDTYIHITKALVDSKTLVSRIEYKKSSTERDGNYYFIAIAAE